MSFLTKKTMNSEQADKLSANLAINVRDITESEILTLDNQVISIFKVDSMNIDLLTDREKQASIKKLTSCISSIKQPYKILALPRPFDVVPFIEALQEQRVGASDLQKQIISNEIAELNKIAGSGKIVERHFYIVLADDIRDDYRRNREEFQVRWRDGDVNVQLIKQQELIRLCNLIFNPSYTDDKAIDLGVMPFLNY